MGGSQSTPAPAEPLAINNNAPKRNTGEADTVIIPVDGSKQSEAAFLWYINHCHKESNVVRVLHCQELHHSAPLSGEQFKADSWVDQMNQTRADSLKVVNRYEQRLKERNIKGSVQFEVGKPGEVVIQYADRFRGTHIVIGTRGFGLLRRTILGSVSEYVIHHSKIPVTIVPPETQSWFF